MKNERINNKLIAYEVELEARYPLPFVRYLLGTPTDNGREAASETIAPAIPPGTYVYPDTTTIDIGTTLYLDPELTSLIRDDIYKYRHLFTSTGIDTTYIIQYDDGSVVTLYEKVK